MAEPYTQERSGTPPVGYKRTAGGMIPDEWQCLQVRDIAAVRGGKRLPSGYALTDSPTPHPYIRVIDMYPGGVRRSGLLYVPEKAFPMIRRYRIYSDDIFISVAGTLGIVGVVPPDLSGANLTENADRITDLECNRDYLMYWLMSQPVQDSISAIATVGAQPKLALERINAFVVILPRKAVEQRAIAAVLSDVDELIGSLEALIAKKRAIKQAAMQELLTGRTQLAGFGGEWEVGRLKLIAQLHREHVAPDPANDTPYTHFSLPAYDAGQGPVIEHGESIHSGKFRVPPDAILLSRLNPRIPRVWSPTSVGPNAVASTEFLVITPKAPTVRAFLYYLCSSSEFWERMVLAVTGTTGSHQRVNRTDAMQLVVRFPKYSREQRAIATILSDMDAEITALEQRLDKTRAIKQGMMQQLLTGAIRLPIPSVDGEADA